jgi:hypothetical protein
MKPGYMSKYCFAVMFFIATAGHVNAQSFTVGAATEKINPSGDSLFLAGGKPNRRFIDVHDNLYVKAVVVSSKNNSMALLTFDCIGLLYPQLLEIRQEVQKQLPSFPADQIVMSSTHTHAGPDVVGIWGPDQMHSGVNEKYMKALVNNAVKALVEAWNARRAATASYANGEFGETWVKNICEPAEVDRSLTVLRFADSQNKNIATLVNFACHPTILDDYSKQASADYVGGWYRFADSAQGGVNMFLQGAIGGWIQPEDVPSSFENADFYGKLLGSQVFSLLPKATAITGDDIFFKSRTVKFPVDNAAFRMLADAGVIKRHFGETVVSEIAWFGIGNAQFMTHPGETVPALSVESKKLMQTNGPKFVMGLSQDALGYILKPSFFVKENNIPHSAYLTSMSLGPQTAGIIEKVLGELVSSR